MKITTGVDGKSLTYHYNSKGYLIEIKDAKSNMPLIGYEYDDLGRVIKNILYTNDGKFLRNETYSYVKDKEFLEVTHYFINRSGSNEDKWRKFDKNGDEKKEYFYDSQGNITGEYNYNKSKVNPRQLVEYY